MRNPPHPLPVAGFESDCRIPEPKSLIEKQVMEKMQTDRQGNLIKYVGTDLHGWNKEKILLAFGEPIKLVELEENLEKWIYHPWTNHPDWEMPVYVQNGVLLKIGD
jgi:hypothetical protein